MMVWTTAKAGPPGPGDDSDPGLARSVWEMARGLPEGRCRPGAVVPFYPPRQPSVRASSAPTVSSGRGANEPLLRPPQGPRPRPRVGPSQARCGGTWLHFSALCRAFDWRHRSQPAAGTWRPRGTVRRDSRDWAVRRRTGSKDAVAGANVCPRSHVSSFCGAE